MTKLIKNMNDCATQIFIHTIFHFIVDQQRKRM
jgi:hypothetical protein